MKCTHAYKMLNQAQNLTCETCLDENIKEAFENGKKEGEQKAQALWDKIKSTCYCNHCPSEDLEQIKKEFQNGRKSNY